MNIINGKISESHCDNLLRIFLLLTMILILLSIFVISFYQCGIYILASSFSNNFTIFVSDKLYNLEFCSIFGSENPYQLSLLFSILVPITCLLMAGYNGRRVRPPFYSLSRKNDDYYLNIYQRCESRLVESEILDQKKMMSYHAQYNWRLYAATAMFIGIPILILETSRLNSFQKSIIGSGTLLMAVATTFLANEDLIHKNFHIPIIPRKSRFRLIKISIAFVGLAF